MNTDAARQRATTTGSRIGALALALSLTTACGVVAGESSAEGGSVESAESEPLSSEVVEAADTGETPAVQTNTFVADPWSTVVTGTLKTDEQYSISMKGEPSVNEKQNEFHPILETTYVWQDGGEQMMLIVSDKTDHFDGGDDPDMQRSAAEIVLLGLMLDSGAAERGSEPIVYVPGDLETKLAGHQIRFESNQGAGVIRSIQKEQVAYSMVSINQSDSDATRFFNSLSIAPYELADLEAEAAAAERVASLTEGAEPFVEGPYGQREMLTASGGPDYFASPPEGAVEPGTFPELDPMFVACREGDGPACDELYWTAFETLGALVYERFADTCGGRTVTERCTDLLGGQYPGEDPIIHSQDKIFYARNYVFRLELVPPPTMAPPGTKPHLDGLWLKCGIEADGEACRDLGLEALEADDDIYAAFAATCGGRMRTFAGAGCVNLMNPELVPSEGSPPPGLDPALDELWGQCAEGDSKACTSVWLEVDSNDALSDEQKDQYNRFGRTCGGVVDRPLTDCNDYANWPVKS